MTLAIAGRRTPDRTLARDEYACRRCGIVRRFNPARDKARPVKCRDCIDVEGAENRAGGHLSRPQTPNGHPNTPRVIPDAQGPISGASA